MKIKADLALPLGSSSPKAAFTAVRNYLAGQFVGATNDDDILNELIKVLFCKLYGEVGRASGELTRGDVVSAKAVKATFDSIKADFPDLFDKNEEIVLSAKDVSYILNLCQFPMLNELHDPIGDAFEVFTGSEARGKAGQFFTPRSVTDLLVEMVSPKPGEKIIDPACGAGGFLASVTRYHIKNGLPPSSLAAVAQDLWGIDKDAYLARLAKLHVALLSAGEPSVECADSIAMRDGSSRQVETVVDGTFDVVFANPPFGAKIVSADEDTLTKYEFAKKWVLESTDGRWHPTKEIRTQVPPQVLFIERCLKLLREGGRLGIVVPESLLSGRAYRFVNQYLLENTVIKAVVGMPDELFKTSGKGGTHTKTCLVILEKQTLENSVPIFMAEAEWCGFDSRAKAIPYNDLPTIRENYKRWITGKNIEENHLGFSLAHDKINEFILCPHYYDHEVDDALKQVSGDYEIVTFQSLLDDGTLELSTGDELGKLSYGTGDIPFIRTSDLSNWEVKIDAKHNVDEATYEKFRKRQDVKPYDIFMVRDGTYLIGTCGIVMPGGEKILYQSHIYKIRVNTNSHGVTPFLLLAILSSPIVQKQIRAKRFTQDIIDSLGDRIKELVLPIPFDRTVREEVSALVEQSIGMRLQARELAREAGEIIGVPTPKGGTARRRRG